MKHSFIISLFLAAAFPIAALGADNVPKGWEPVKTDIRENTKSIVKDADVEIRTAPSAIYISTPHPLQIKVFTILGRIISDGNLPAGSSRLSLPTHGVYIIKAGTSLTCKVAV